MPRNRHVPSPRQGQDCIRRIVELNRHRSYIAVDENRLLVRARQRLAIARLIPSASKAGWCGQRILCHVPDRSAIGSGNGITPAFVPENGWWWNESESGRGFFMEFKNNFAFIAGYMYEADGRPVWYTAQKAMTTPQTFSTNWLQVANGQTLMGSYKAPIIVNSNVGPVTIQFNDAANAILTLPGGRNVAITRHRF